MARLSRFWNGFGVEWFWEVGFGRFLDGFGQVYKGISWMVLQGFGVVLDVFRRVLCGFGCF